MYKTVKHIHINVHVVSHALWPAAIRSSFSPSMDYMPKSHTQSQSYSPIHVQGKTPLLRPTNKHAHMHSTDGNLFCHLPLRRVCIAIKGLDTGAQQHSYSCHPEHALSWVFWFVCNAFPLIMTELDKRLTIFQVQSSHSYSHIGLNLYGPDGVILSLVSQQQLQWAS